MIASSAGVACNNIKDINIAKNIMTARSSAAGVECNDFEGMQDLLKGRVGLYLQDLSKSESASFLSWWLWQSRRGHYLLEVVLDVVVDAPECLEHHTILAAIDFLAWPHVRDWERKPLCASSVLKRGYKLQDRYLAKRLVCRAKIASSFHEAAIGCTASLVEEGCSILSCLAKDPFEDSIAYHLFDGVALVHQRRRISIQ